MKKGISTYISQLVWGKNILLTVGIFLLYVICGKVGLLLAFVNPSTTAIWAPTGIALAAVLLFGFRALPAIFFGAFFVNLTTAGTPATSLGIAFGNMLEAVAGAYFVRKFASGTHAFDSVLGIFKFTLFAVIFSTMVSATVGFVTLFFGGFATFHDFWTVWSTWWFGDMGGNVIVAPFLLVWAAHPRIHASVRGLLHFFIVVALLVITTEVIFLGITPYPYLCIPLAVWIAFWFGRRGAVSITLLVAILATVNTINGMGPFAHVGSPNHSLLLLQTFLGVFSLTGLIFATMILEYRNSQKTISTQERRFKALIEKSFDAVVLIDSTSRISYASPTFEKIIGYAPEEIQGKIGFDLIYAEDRQRITKELAKLVLKPGGTVTVEYRSIRKDGEIIWVEATGTNLLLDANVGAIVVNFHDITDRKLSAEKLLEEKIEDEAMLGSIGDGVFATDNNGKITMINQAACAMLGWSEKELLGHSIVEVVPLQDELGKALSMDERPLTKVLTLGKSIITSSTIYYLKKDGTKFPVHFTVTPIILDKKVVGAIEVFHDITREREVDKAKTEFVSVASHQLRTPLATINWYLEELLQSTSNFSQKQLQYLQEVYNASKRMVNLINTLLNASRLELGTFTVEPSEVNIPEVIDQTVKDFSQKIKEKHVTVSIECSKDLPPMHADPKLLSIIIQNLLGNAVKYTKTNDTIVITIKENKKEFLLSVAEHGYGIPKNQQAKIFTKLFRADNARMIEPEGTGLGLYIVKSIISETGGKIWFESEENKGTTFYVSFPHSGMQQKKGQKQLI